MQCFCFMQNAVTVIIIFMEVESLLLKSKRVEINKKDATFITSLLEVLAYLTTKT